MNDIKVGDTPFNVIMQQAVKMKTARHAVDRRRYDGLPRFVQNSMFGSADLSAKRRWHISERLKAARDLKEEGNQLFRRGDGGESMLDCTMKYEKAIALFRYIENTNANWKKSCIDDNDMVYHDFLADGKEHGTAEELNQAMQICLSCYLNLAAAYMKMGDYKEAVQAADYALDLDPKNTKALYRRAVARYTPASAGATDLDLALKDLEVAHQTAPEDSTIRKAHSKLKASLKKQKRNDKMTFGKLFERGAVYREQDVDQNERARRANASEERQAEEKGEPFHVQLREAESIKRQLEENGDHEKATEIQKVIDKAKLEYDQRRSNRPKLDWKNPTPEMITDAEKHGIDLNDPQVVSLLEELQDGQKTGNTQPAADAQSEPDEARIREVLTALEALPESDLKGLLEMHALGENVTAAAKRRLAEIIARDMKKEKANKLVKKKTFVEWLLNMSFWQRSVLFTCLIFLFRLWRMGLLWQGVLLLSQLLGLGGNAEQLEWWHRDLRDSRGALGHIAKASEGMPLDGDDWSDEDLRAL